MTAPSANGHADRKRQRRRAATWSAQRPILAAAESPYERAVCAAARAAGLKVAPPKARPPRDLMESVFGMDWVSPYMDLFDRLRTDPVLTGPAAAWNRKWGRNYPLYQSEQELALLRAPARIMCGTNDYAIGMQNTVVNYVVGTGFTYLAVPKKGGPENADVIADAVQVLIDEFIERTEWQGGEVPSMEREFVQRSREDGEAILLHFLGDDGTVDVRTVEPEQLTAAPGGDPAEWLFGIHTPGDDVQRILGYWIYFGDAPSEGCEYAPDVVTHFRCNAKRSIKRGISDYTFSTYDALSLADKLRTNLGDTAAQQAAIVYVMQHETGTRAEVQQFADDKADYTQRVPLSQSRPEEGVEMKRRGREEHIPKGQVYVAPPTASNQPIHLEVLQGLCRAAGRRWGMTESMISGDACLSEDSQLLTGRGWVGVHDLRDDDLIGTVRPDTHELEYQKATQRFCTHRTGQMVHLWSDRFDLLVTPNHDIYLSKFFMHREDWRKVPASELLDWPHRAFKCKANVRWAGGTNPERMTVPGLGEFSADLVLRFLGLFIGDGSTAADYPRVSVGGITRPRKLRYYAPILEELGFKLHVGSDGRHMWYIDSWELRGWLRDQIGTNCDTKRLPSLTWSLGTGGLDAIWEGLLQSDGYTPPGSRKVRTYSTTSGALADDVQILSLRRGQRASISPCPPGAKGTLPIFKVHVSPAKPAEIVRGQVRSVDYDGLVWCVQVPNGLIVSRRNGKVAVSGNSNNNMASQLISNDPFVIAIRAAQHVYGQTFKRTMWLVVRHHIDTHGRLVAGGRGCTFEQVKAAVEIQVEGPNPEVRDRMADAQRRQIERQNGVLSPQSWATEEGYDAEQEQRQIDEWNDRNASQGAAPELDLPGDSGGVPSDPFDGTETVSESLLESILLEGKAGLVQKKITVQGKSGPYQKTVWVKVAQAAKAAPKKAAKPAVADVVAKFTELKGKATPAKVKAAVETLKQLTVVEIGQVKKALGVKASGTKAVLAQKVAAALAKPKKVKAAPKPKTLAKPIAKVEPKAAQEPIEIARYDPERTNAAVGDNARPKLNRAESDAVELYSTDDYRAINAGLRGGALSGDHAKTHEAMQGLFARTPALEKPVTVYRGMSMADEQLRSFLGDAKPGATMKLDGYTSTTTNTNQAAQFSKPRAAGQMPVIVEIEANHGLDLKPHSTNPVEDEFLLNHASRFEVVGVEEKGGVTRVKLKQKAG